MVGEKVGVGWCRFWSDADREKWDESYLQNSTGIISHWFLRKCSSMPSLDSSNSQGTKEVIESRILNLPELKNINKDLDYVDNMHSQTINNSCGKLANENSDSNNKKYKHSSSGKDASPVNISEGTGKDDNDTGKCNEMCENINSTKKEADNINEVLNQNGEKEWPKGSPPGPPSELQKIDMDAFPKT
ncbi:uncharacterized protein Fot_31631 [Forsythia ovata]|uniref:Uncharacterized protein n=1 Tax=Forsythia ovata TaxID=205694 RepID=A0ABD1T5J9_9LAMI